MKFKVEQDKLNGLIFCNWPNLPLKERSYLYYMAKKYMSDKAPYGSKCAIICAQRVSQSMNYIFYKALVAEFSSCGVKSTCKPKTAYIVTNYNALMLYRINDQKTIEVLCKQNFLGKDFVTLNFNYPKLYGISNNEILEFISYLNSKNNTNITK